MIKKIFQQLKLFFNSGKTSGDKQRVLRQKQLNRLFLLLVITLAFLSGFYMNLYNLEQRKYLRLEDAYIRLQTMLGEQKVRELINSSYQYIDNTGKVIQSR